MQAQLNQISGIIKDQASATCLLNKNESTIDDLEPLLNSQLLSQSSDVIEQLTNISLQTHKAVAKLFKLVNIVRTTGWIFRTV